MKLPGGPALQVLVFLRPHPQLRLHQSIYKQNLPEFCTCNSLRLLVIGPVGGRRDFSAHHAAGKRPRDGRRFGRVSGMNVVDSCYHVSVPGVPERKSKNHRKRLGVSCKYRIWHCRLGKEILG